jgi:hypothetical protein
MNLENSRLESLNVRFALSKPRVRLGLGRPCALEDRLGSRADLLGLLHQKLCPSLALSGIANLLLRSLDLARELGNTTLEDVDAVQSLKT